VNRKSIKAAAKDKALEAALSALKKEFGDAFDTRGIVDGTYKAVPTGYDDLDDVLTKGAKGLYLGGIVEIFGPEHSGKCLTADTYCLCKDGLLSVEEIFDYCGMTCDRGSGFTDRQYEILNELNELETTSHFYKNGNAVTNLKTIEITTRDGFRLEGTYKHPVRVLDSSGFVVWKCISDINEGDYTCISRGSKCWGENPLANEQNCALIGYLLGDGGISGINRIVFTNADEQIISQYKEALASSLSDFDVPNKLKQYGYDYVLFSKESSDFIHDQFQLPYVKSCDKLIPKFVRSAGQECQTAFIRAYFDCDGTFQHDKLNLQFSSCSLEMLRQLQLMLLNFGIFGHITTFHNKVYDRDYYELEFAGEEVYLYRDEIGFNNNPKSSRIQYTLSNNDKLFNKKLDSIPNQMRILSSFYDSIDPSERCREIYRVFEDAKKGNCLLSYSRLQNIIDVCNDCLIKSGSFSIIEEHYKTLMAKQFVFSPVVQIEKSNNKTYDFTLPKTHTFWSNGLISHNTSLAMRAVAQAQNLGYHCAWLDAEATFAPDLAEINGVNLETLIMPELANLKDSADDEEEEDLSKKKIKKGNTSGITDARKLLHMIYKILITNQFKLVVVDSVAGLMPERILKVDHDPNKNLGMGEVANAMAEYLKPIAQACQGTESTVILVNQLRDQPGKLFQDQYHTPGGRAMKFWASQRINVSKVTGAKGRVVIIDENGNEELIGHYANVTIVKNKRNRPLDKDYVLQIPIYYCEYFPDDAKKVYDLAKKMQVITMRKSVFTWKVDDEVIFKIQGEADVLEHIRKENLVGALAFACVTAEAFEKNQSRTSPIKVSSSIRSLAVDPQIKTEETVKPKKKGRPSEASKDADKV